jgi:hypothetical protein
MGNGRRDRLVVTKEAIADFSTLSYAQRLKWLDEMRAFFGKVTSSPKRRRKTP